MFGMRVSSSLVASLALVLPAALLTSAAASGASVHAATCPPVRAKATVLRAGHISGVATIARTGACARGAATLDPHEPPYLSGSKPPLKNHGGPVMDVTGTTNLVVTPIFWTPTGGTSTYSFASGYETLISKFLTDVGADSGKRTNVFSTLTQYAGSNGSVHYAISAGPAVTDAKKLPTSLCTVSTGQIYSDNSGYTACIDDDQVQAEIAHVVSKNSLPTDLNHIYALFLPKGIESCFYSKTEIPSGQANACTINYSPTAAYCGYHSSFGTGDKSVYDAMPFPVYESGTGYTCSSDRGSRRPESPNSNVDADTVISTLSHEVSEAMTDPDGNAWYASDGNENGDLCAYIYGNVAGTPGHLYNQTINGDHYLTQEEFSNKEYAKGVAGCVPDQLAPTLTSLGRVAGPASGGRALTIHGTSFRPGTTTVKFGTKPGTSVHVSSPTTLTAVPPSHPLGQVDIRVTTPNGTTPVVRADKYRFAARPAVSKVSPASGRHAGGAMVTVTGRGFTGATSVKFGTISALHFRVVSPTKLTVRTPAHRVGRVAVRITTPGGTSNVSNADHYKYT